MKPYFLVHTKIIPHGGMAVWPFVFMKPERKGDKRLENHEAIHIRQQLEMLWVGFFLMYGIFYLINLVKYKNHNKAYRNIIFEREAFEMDDDLDYLNKRKFWAWVRF